MARIQIFKVFHSVIRLEKISKGYGTKVLFEDINYHFPTGERISLVGPNGAGKSTLLNIIASVEEADSGKVTFPGQCVLAYLPQEPNSSPAGTVLLECQSGRNDLIELRKKMEAALEKSESGDLEQLSSYEQMESSYRHAGGYALEAKAGGILDGLGFPEEYLSKSALELSGGWRMRLELAKLFLREADFLILDEPTNHLDLPSLVWVENFLMKFRGTLLFVSHDRELLNRLPTQTLHMSNGKLKQYKGNFDSFIAQKQLLEEQEESTLEQIKKKKDQLEDFVNRFGTKASKAKQAQSKMKMIDRLTAQEGDLGQDQDESSIAFKLPTPTRGPRIPMTFTKGSIGYDSPLAKNIEFQVERKYKVAVIGANGVGKSTLIKTLAGHLNPLAGELVTADNVQVSYFSQDQLDTLDESKSVIDNLLASSADMGQMEARSLLGSFLFRNDDVFKEVSVLSGGEKGRLGLACVLAQNANFLLLDEPTNHLDMSSVEALTAAIQDYEGTVVFVSHDRTFINNCCTHVFAMPGTGETMIFEGTLPDYERLAGIANFPNVLSLEPTTPPTKEKSSSAQESASNANSGGNFKEISKGIAKLERQMTSETKEIENHKATIDNLDKKMVEVNPSAFDEINRLDQERTNTQDKLDDTENSWLENLEAIEDLKQQLVDMGHRV